MEFLDCYSVSRIQEACWVKDDSCLLKVSCCPAVMSMTPSLKRQVLSTCHEPKQCLPCYRQDPDYQLRGTVRITLPNNSKKAMNKISQEFLRYGWYSL